MKVEKASCGSLGSAGALLRRSCLATTQGRWLTGVCMQRQLRASDCKAEGSRVQTVAGDPPWRALASPVALRDSGAQHRGRSDPETEV